MGSGASTGAIALRNCVQKSLVFSPALSQTSLRAKSLHRDVLRSVPWVKRAYSVPLAERQMRALLSTVFRDNKDVADLHQINRLIALGRMELEETLMLWKGESHILQLFDELMEKEEQKDVAQPTFLDKFFNDK